MQGSHLCWRLCRRLVNYRQGCPDVRYTVDVDCIVNVITRTDYYAIAKKLRQKGFKELVACDHPICRWDCDGVLIDVMPVDKSVFGFSNRWYQDAQAHAIEQKITETIYVKIISAPYFLGRVIN